MEKKLNDYCSCCASNLEHIRQHYDVDGLTKKGEDPAATLAIFRACFPAECDLQLKDVAAYVESL